MRYLSVVLLALFFTISLNTESFGQKATVTKDTKDINVIICSNEYSGTVQSIQVLSDKHGFMKMSGSLTDGKDRIGFTEHIKVNGIDFSGQPFVYRNVFILGGKDISIEVRFSSPQHNMVIENISIVPDCPNP